MSATERLSREEGGAQLTVAVAAGDKAPMVIEASATGDDTGVLDDLCQAIVGKPLLEAADHGVLQVIDRRRAAGQDFGVPGIVTVKAAGEPFLRARRLVRGVLEDYRAATGYTETGNPWNPVPADDWRAKSDQDRRADLTAAMARFCADKGLEAEAIALSRLESDTRLTVEIKPSVPISEQPRLLMALERALRAAVPARIEVFVEEMEDINQTRQL